MESPLSFDSTENFRKKLLLKNLKPYRVDGFYSPTDIITNKDFFINDYSVIDSTPLDITSKIIEPNLIGQNKYTPQSGSFGEIVNINLNKTTQTNLGFYGYPKTEKSFLEIFGKTKEKELVVQNQYGPEGQQSKTTVTPNVNFQKKANEGNYGYSDTINNGLEKKGNELEKFLRVLNKYGPEKGGGQYGDTVVFEIKTFGINTGEYKNQKDAEGSELETVGQRQEVFQYVKNKYGPATKGGRSYGSTVDINKDQQTQTNFGEYLPTESSGDNSPLEIFGEQSLTILLNNTFQPFNPVEATPNDNVEQKPNKGEYLYGSFVGKTTEESQTFYYAKNKYNSGEGTFTTPEEVTYINETINSPYRLSDSTFAFIPSDYLPVSILTTDNVENINGSDGKLSQDSTLAQIAAKQLQKEFKARVAFELLQQTLGRSTLSNSSISPDSGGISVKPNLNPFDALGVLSNNLPIIQRDFKITQPLIDTPGALSFTARLSGLYSPYSIIPGEYFDYPNRNFISQIQDNPIGSVNNLLNNLVNKIASPLIDTSSELFLSNTSDAVRGLLFDQLFYNFYRPNYLLTSLRNPNLLAPQGNYYIGSNKNFIRDAVSPKTDLAKWKNGKANVGPVFSYSEISKEYEGQKVTDILFGTYSKPFYDSVGIQGGFTWVADNNIYQPGKFVGPGNLQINNAGTDTVFERSSFGPEYNKTKSSDFDLTEGSLLDVTQKLVQAANNSSRRSEHVGNAINQVSKVFKDGLLEMTKGSKVIRYTTPNSVDKTATIKGYEYCRLFTKDRPYYTFNELQKKDGNIRKFNNSVLDKTYNLNIAPMGSQNGLNSTNIGLNDQGKIGAKKYMFSIENLAWRSSNRQGFTVDDLPACESGPNGGRIMWFPPYDLTFNDTSQAQWEPIRFLGRPEPLYVYKSTERTGSLSFKIVVDHPSIMNIIVKKELEKETSSDATKIIDSFFAGCLKYDPIDLLKKYRQFSLSDIFEATTSLRTIRELQQVTNELPKEKVTEEKEVETNIETVSNENKSQDINTANEEIKKESEKGGKFEEIILFFDQSVPFERTTLDPDKAKSSTLSESDYETLYNKFISNETSYKKEVSNIPSYPDGYYLKFQTTRNDYGKPGNYVKYKTVEEVEALNTKQTTNPKIDQKNLATEYIIFKKSSLDNLYVDIKQQKSNFDEFLKKVASALDSGSKVEFSIVASANANGDDSYNDLLSQRRYDAVLQTILKFPTSDGTLKKYYEKELTINKVFEGKQSILKTEKYSNISCAKPFPSSQKEGYSSVQAMLCRRTTITEVKVTPPEIKPEENKTVPVPDKEKVDLESSGPNPDAGSDNTTDNPTPQYKIVDRQISVASADPRLKGLTKKLLRRLLSECDYFDMLQEQQPMVFDGIKSKIKNFQPTFHSITPEGLNSRLTFLHQCTRPGDTIPTAKATGINQTSLEYNDVFNSAFGTPPIVVIRVGDFYHTKAIIDSVQLKYDDAKFDLNPEGIGVQPMIADVTLSLKFIGGHGLAKPVAQIQNALSFNYYANTEMYDERATETEPVADEITAEVLDGIKDEYGILTVKDKKENNAGNTIGTILSNFLDVTTSAVTGTIQYKTKMNELSNITKSYFDTILSNFEKINEEALIGGIIIYNNDRKYTQGLFNWLSGSTNNKVNIFGKTNSFFQTIRKVVDQAKSDVENETSPILGGLANKNFDKDEKRKIKRKLKELIEEKYFSLIDTISSAQRNVVDNELKLIQITDELNYVCDKVDGYINKRGGVVAYNISGTTGYLDPESLSLGLTNTFDELVYDYLKVGNDLNLYNQKLDEYKIIPSGDPYTFNTDYLFEMYLRPDLETKKGYETVQKEINVFFMTMGKQILDDYKKFVEDVVSAIPSSADSFNPETETFRDPWRVFLYSNLGFVYNTDNGTTTKRNEGLYQDFERSKTETNKLFQKFKDEFISTFLSNNQYKPYNEQKERVMDYEKQNPTLPPYDQNLKDVWSSVDIPGEFFNLKKTLN
jgi:outer membrane protein OmpA-like peptidoglycan-associated protein